MKSWRARTGFAVGLSAALLGAATMSPATMAIFTDAQAVANNTLSAEWTFGGSYFATGAHAGNGVDNRAITGLGFQPGLVILKGNTAQAAQIRTSTMAGDVTKPLVGATALTGGSNRIQALTADGFTLGTNATVNGNAVDYSWAASVAVAGGLIVGSYTGNGTAFSVTGLGFQPEFVIVMSAGANRAVLRTSTMTTTYRFDNTAATAGGIASLDADGFTVGNSAETNASAVVNYYAAFNVQPGAVAVSSYAGTGVDNRSITGLGFQPEYVIVRSATATTEPSHRTDSMAGDSTLRFGANTNVANRIQAIQADGFQVGTDATVNTSGVTYHYVAFNDP